MWIGLRNLNKLTNIPGQPMELRIDLENWTGEKSYAIYKNFRIGTEVCKERLCVLIN